MSFCIWWPGAFSEAPDDPLDAPELPLFCDPIEELELPALNPPEFEPLDAAIAGAAPSMSAASAKAMCVVFISLILQMIGLGQLAKAKPVLGQGADGSA